MCCIDIFKVLVIKRCFGSTVFVVCVCRASLPEHLRQPDITFGQFKRSLNVWLAGPRRPVASLR